MEHQPSYSLCYRPCICIIPVKAIWNHCITGNQSELSVLQTMYLYYTSESYLEPLYHWEPKWIVCATDHVFVLYQWKLFGATVALGTKVNSLCHRPCICIIPVKAIWNHCITGNQSELSVLQTMYLYYTSESYLEPLYHWEPKWIVCAADHVFVLYQWNLFGATVSLGTKVNTWLVCLREAFKITCNFSVQNFKVPKSTTIISGSFYYNVIPDWTSLPSETKSITNKQQFKKSVKKPSS